MDSFPLVTWAGKPEWMTAVDTTLGGIVAAVLLVVYVLGLFVTLDSRPPYRTENARVTLIFFAGLVLCVTVGLSVGAIIFGLAAAILMAVYALQWLN